MSESHPVAIVTGGAQGLGAAICVELLKLGYKVCVADVQERKGKSFVEDQQKLYGSDNVLFSFCDVSKETDYKSTFELTLHVFKKIDILVNNAGVNLADAARLLQVNLLGAINGCHTALKYMGKNNGGKGGLVINIASLAGLIPVPAMPVYSASKHGIVGLTRSYGAPSHFRKEGLVFAALCPSAIDTEMLQGVKEQNLMADTPQRLDAMSPEFAAKGVIKILQDKINGSTLLVMLDGYEYVGYPEELKHKFLLDQGRIQGSDLGGHD